MTMRRILLLLFAAVQLAILPVLAKSQSTANAGETSGIVISLAPATIPVQQNLKYTRPTHQTTFRNYLFDTLGPYPVAIAAFTSGIDQANNTPPEWKQGAQAYGKRFASDLGTAAVSTTTRYALSTAFREDALYYRCECKGMFPRLGHAVVSTLTARRGDDGHRVFSFASLAAPYVGTMTAVYGWYPDRYNARDAFRMGNYSLLGSVGMNIATEFLFSGPHSLFSRMQLRNANGMQHPGSAQ
jgi:hypothetical protein